MSLHQHKTEQERIDRIKSVHRLRWLPGNKRHYWQQRVEKDFVRKGNKYSNLYSNYSILKKLSIEGKIDENFEQKLANISLEELIAAKLEATTKATGGIVYTMPLLYSLKSIVRSSLIHYAVSVAECKRDVAVLLGVSYTNLIAYLKRWDFWTSFNEYFFVKRRRARRRFGTLKNIPDLVIREEDE